MAGGRSRRMGQDKLSMPLADGRRLLDAAADALRQHCGHLVYLGPEPASLPPLSGFEPLRDYHDSKVPLGSGPMAGLLASLLHAEQVGARWVLVLAGDLPLVRADQLTALVEQAESQESPNSAPGNGQKSRPSEQLAAVVPVSDHGPEPLLAAYPASFAAAAKDYLHQGRRSLRGFLSQQLWISLLSTGLDTIPDCTNLNRPEDWERLPDPADQAPET